MVASLILYPFNLIRSRQQQLNQNFFKNLNNNTGIENEFYKYKTIYTNQEYGNFLKTTKTIFNLSGMQGFYKGLVPLLIRQVPGSSIFFYTYEFSLKNMNKYF